MRKGEKKPKKNILNFPAHPAFEAAPTVRCDKLYIMFILFLFFTEKWLQSFPGIMKSSYNE